MTDWAYVTDENGVIVRMVWIPAGTIRIEGESEPRCEVVWPMTPPTESHDE